MTSTWSPIRRSRDRAPGSAAQPASCPWVIATIRRAPARRSAGASSPSGAAAPNSTVSQPCSARIPAARRATDGTGSISEPGCRTTGKGCRASNSAAPSQAGRVDGHLAGRQPARERVHERLNPAAARREVIGDDQDIRHRAPVPVILAAGGTVAPGRAGPGCPGSQSLAPRTAGVAPSGSGAASGRSKDARPEAPWVRAGRRRPGWTDTSRSARPSRQRRRCAGHR